MIFPYSTFSKLVNEVLIFISSHNRRGLIGRNLSKSNSSSIKTLVLKNSGLIFYLSAITEIILFIIAISQKFYHFFQVLKKGALWWLAISFLFCNCLEAIDRIFTTKNVEHFFLQIDNRKKALDTKTFLPMMKAWHENRNQFFRCNGA